MASLKSQYFHTGLKEQNVANTLPENANTTQQRLGLNKSRLLDTGKHCFLTCWSVLKQKLTLYFCVCPVLLRIADVLIWVLRISNLGAWGGERSLRG